jgi:OmpA-OmpF porin, OOP family
MIPLLLLAGCLAPLDVPQQLAHAEQAIANAHRFYGPRCAPIELANAQANLDFARMELSGANLVRAKEHLDLATRWGDEALAASTACGGRDSDGDSVVDIADRCPDQKEDLDGDDDEDGCLDVSPIGDEDGDGVVNVDDGCINTPEDMDGVYDDDGCPETEDDSDGDGVIDAVDACENEPEDRDGFQDSDGCPDPDNDQDSILDFVDKCPDEAEDRDGWVDEDGCLELDNDQDGVQDGNDLCRNAPGDADKDGCPADDLDNDGIADTADRCPLQPESPNGYLDDDGCPDTAVTGIKVTSTRVEIEGTVQFQSGSATLLPQSYDVLNNVAKVLQDASYLKLRIEGHTDGEAAADFNLELSRERAVAVMKYLVAQGVADYRLEALGFGETRPIDTNRTVAGRARNRRVEFHIVN